MPLEINEIGIHMRVSESARVADDRQPQSVGSDGREINQEELLEECVRRVLQALRSMKER
jgi:hypothetical protein